MRTKKVPMRRCVGCREMKEKRQLIRVVKNNEGEIFIDSTGKKNGRGAYLCKSLDCYGKARKAKSLSHEFSCEIPDQVYEDILEQLEGYAEK